MDGDLSQAEVCSLGFQDVSRIPWEKTTSHGCVLLYLKITKGNKDFPFCSPFTELSAHALSAWTFPRQWQQMPSCTKDTDGGKVPYKEKVFPSWAMHTFSLGSSYKGKRPKHVLHINGSYIHRQSRVQEWHSFICLWLISQSVIYIFLH